MRRLAWWALPIVLAAAGIALIIVGTRDREGAALPSLPPIVEPSITPVAQASPTPDAADSVAGSPTESATASPVPTQTPLPAGVTAGQLAIESVGINVLVRQSEDQETNNFPPGDAAYVLMGSSQPGKNTNSYIFAHATEALFKKLWNVQLGAVVLIEMSDGTVLRYVVTEVHQNVPCPDADADPALNPPDPPAALRIHDDCSEGVFWLAPTRYERLTLQTSQGFNRNWGEFIVVAEPAG